MTTWYEHQVMVAPKNEAVAAYGTTWYRQQTSGMVAWPGQVAWQTETGSKQNLGMKMGSVIIMAMASAKGGRHLGVTMNRQRRGVGGR